VSIETPGTALYDQKELTATISGGSSPVRAWIEVDGAYLTTLPASGKFILDSTQLTDGQHSLNITAEDAYGRRGHAGIVITVANNGPAVSIITPATQGEATDVSLSISSQWPIASVQIWLDGNLFGKLTAEPWTMPLDMATLNNGEHRLNVTAVDAHGRTGVAEVVFQVANAGPVVSILTPTADGEITMNSSVTLSVTSLWPIASVQVWIDDVLLGNLTSAPWTLPLDITAVAEGTHQLRVSALDSHNGVGNATISFATRIVRPQLELGEPTGTSGSVDFPLTTNMPLAYVVYYLDGVEVLNSSATPFTCTIDTSAYADGPHMLNATAVLTDGSSMQLTKEVQFLNSVKAPGVSAVLDFKDLDLIFLQVLIIVLVLAVVIGKARSKKKK
jgi:hypothetical protein